jgi:hypothetical protein
LGVASGFVPGQIAGDSRAAAEWGHLVIGLFLRDPERGAITRDAPILQLLNDRALCEVCRRLRLSRAAKSGLSRGSVGLHFWDLALNLPQHQIPIDPARSAKTTGGTRKQKWALRPTCEALNYPDARHHAYCQL